MSAYSEVLQEGLGSTSFNSFSNYSMTSQKDTSVCSDKVQRNNFQPILNKQLLDPVDPNEISCRLYDHTMAKQEPAQSQQLKTSTTEEESHMNADQMQAVVKQAFGIQKTSQMYGKSVNVEKVSKQHDRLVAGVPIVETNYQSPASQFRMARKNKRDVRASGVWNHVPVLSAGRSSRSTPMVKRDEDRISADVGTMQAQLTRADFEVPTMKPAGIAPKKDRLEFGSDAFQMAQRMNAPQLDDTIERLPFVSLSRRN